MFYMNAKCIEVPKAMPCDVQFEFRCHGWWFACATLRIAILSYFWSFYFSQLDLEGSLSPVIAPKKARPSETGSDEVRNGFLLQVRALGVGGWFG